MLIPARNLVRVLISGGLLLNVRAGLGGVREPNHLVPVESVFSSLSGIEYESELRVQLIIDPDTSPYERYVRVICMPSFRNEWLVEIRDAAGEQPLVVYREVKFKMVEFKMEGMEGKPKRRRYTGVKEAKATMSTETANLLRAAWLKMLRGVHYPEPVDFGRFDGVSWYFESWASGVGTLAGETWSPEAGSHPGQLVALADALREMALAPHAKRGAIEANLKKSAQSLLETIGEKKW